MAGICPKASPSALNSLGPIFWVAVLEASRSKSGNFLSCSLKLWSNSPSFTNASTTSCLASIAGMSTSGKAIQRRNILPPMALTVWSKTS